MFTTTCRSLKTFGFLIIFLISTTFQNFIYRKKTTFATDKLPSVLIEDTLSMIKENELASSYASTNAPSSVIQESPPPKPNTIGTTRRRSSLSQVLSGSQSSYQQSQQSLHACGGSNIRRKSIPAKRNAPAFVHQDELWLTQRQCKPKCLFNDNAPKQEG